MTPPHLRCLSVPGFSWSPPSSSSSLLLRKFGMSVNQRTSYAEGKPALRGVVFDMDGTLTVPVIDFAAMYRAVLGDEGYTAAKFGSPGGSVDILHHIETWPPQEQQRAYEIIADFERQGLDRLQIMPGLFSVKTFFTFFLEDYLICLLGGKAHPYSFIFVLLWRKSPVANVVTVLFLVEMGKHVRSLIN
ncbi:haloacid dehalogenase-like hydrolase domain-containing protein At2g33255 [Dendrobium catenatum]|uniref:haloacid dehalogenase-like hydrolase domain-containing protein At2g33255 n=1 Tax=Dendrobium catenatum TaxID=906689 RepID=UPI0009F1FF8E|nr:haloacid dehalogenase-like hydrolase domain-containing protein At2g33255 [Dendrobium catenatum]